MTITQTQRRLVRDRANNCCEYCRLSATDGTIPFHIDHFIPRKHDGSDNNDNLCFACFNCNMYKSHDLTGFDPNTGIITPLFNPRKHIWKNHFRINLDMRIEGLTPEGRTTIRVLQLNLDERIESRQVLAQLSHYPCKNQVAE